MKLLKEDFPDARIIASTFDAFARPLARAVRDGLQLPVVWEEIGDTCASWARTRVQFRVLIVWEIGDTCAFSFVTLPDNGGHWCKELGFQVEILARCQIDGQGGTAAQLAFHDTIAVACIPAFTV